MELAIYLKYRQTDALYTYVLTRDVCVLNAQIYARTLQEYHNCKLRTMVGFNKPNTYLAWPKELDLCRYKYALPRRTSKRPKYYSDAPPNSPNITKYTKNNASPLHSPCYSIIITDIRLLSRLHPLGQSGPPECEVILIERS